MFGFAGSGPDTPAGVAGDGEPTGGGAISCGFSSADSSGSDGLIEMRGLSFNDGGFAAGVPAADRGGGGAARAIGIAGGAPSGALSERSFSFNRGSWRGEGPSLMRRKT